MRTSIINSFDSLINDRGDHIAIEHNGKTMTFYELGRMANGLGCEICRLTASSLNKPIAVFLPKGIETVTADIGVMLSGNIFMNLDISTPVERIGRILENVEPVLIITDDEHASAFEKCNVSVLLINSYTIPANQCDNYKRIIDTDPFCIINTSGSTGTPKSVVLNHRSFFDFMDWSIEEFSFTEEDIIGSLSPIVFDIFVFELCLLITKGCRIILIDGMLASFPVRLADKLCQSDITFIFWVPTIMVNMANMDILSGRNPNQLRLVWFAGEVFPTKQFLYWYDMLPNTVFVNMYGPIEITLDCTYHLFKSRPNENEPLPIGIPCGNTDIILLNEENKEADTGEEAELCVRGTSLAMGYYNNPEKTAAAFTANPLNYSYPETIYRTGDIVVRSEDGLLYIKGRKDSMIKHNGYRIELAEIEHVITNHTNLIQNCCCVYNKNSKRIVLYYESEKDVERAAFRKAAAGFLPKYMIPDIYVRVDELPRNTNGKIDRLSLQEQLTQNIKVV